MSDEQLARIEVRLDNIHEDLQDMDETVCGIDQRVRSLETAAAGIGYAIGGLGLLATVIAIAAALSSCAAPSYVQQPALMPPVESVVALVDDTGSPFCSGVALDEGVLTAAHCVEDVDTVRVAVASAWDADRLGYTSAWTATVERRDERLDLALLSRVQLPAVQLGPRARQGDRVAVVGQVFGLPFAVSRGYVASAHCVNVGGVCLQVIDANCGPGDSGGPVFTSDGRTVGVLVRGVGGPFYGYPLHLIVPADTVAAFLRR